MKKILLLLALCASVHATEVSDLQTVDGEQRQKISGLLTTTGTYVLKTGDTMTGNLIAGSASIRTLLGADGGGGLLMMSTAHNLHIGDNAGSYVISIPSNAQTSQTVFGTKDGTTGSTLLQGDLITFDGGTQYTPTVLTPGTTVNIDFNASYMQTLANATNVTFTASNAAAGKKVLVIVTNDGTARNVTSPGWTSIGSAFPSSIAANKVLMFEVVCSSATTNLCYVTSGAQP